MALLGGSGVVISVVISPPTCAISIVTLLITLLVTTHEPPSMDGCSFSPFLPESANVRRWVRRLHSQRLLSPN